MNREIFSANHRCPKRRHGVRILRDYASLPYCRYDGWHFFRMDWDLDYDSHHCMEVCPITYCPFCGKRLDEPEYLGIDSGHVRRLCSGKVKQTRKGWSVRYEC